MTEIRFPEEKMTLLLNVKKEDIDLKKYQEISKGFEQKSEFHITIIGFRGGKEIKKALLLLNQSNQFIMIEKIKTLVGETDWDYFFLNVAYQISKEYSNTDKRESIIQLAEVPGFVKFYDSLNEMLNLQLEYPLIHATLFTRGTDLEKSKMGIGINSEIDFFELNPLCIKI